MILDGSQPKGPMLWSYATWKRINLIGKIPINWNELGGSMPKGLQILRDHLAIGKNSKKKAFPIYKKGTCGQKTDHENVFTCL